MAEIASFFAVLRPIIASVPGVPNVFPVGIAERHPTCASRCVPHIVSSLHQDTGFFNVTMPSLPITRYIPPVDVYFPTLLNTTGTALSVVRLLI